MWDKLCQDFSRLRALYFPNNAVLYAFISAKKVFTPSHRVRFCLIFNGFECEGLDFQVFTSTVAFYRVYLLIFGLFSGVKAYAFHPSQAFTARVNALLPM